MSITNAFTIPFRDTTPNLKSNRPVQFSPSIPISLLKRNKGLFISVICNAFHFVLRYTINRVLSWVHAFTVTMIVLLGRLGCLTRRDSFYLRYPPDTKAFLYYLTFPEKPRIMITGELRFPVTPSDDPESFESGSEPLTS